MPGLTDKLLDMLHISHHGDATSHLLSHDSKVAGQRFDFDEMFVLRTTWKEMSERNSYRGIDKEHFLQYFPLKGLLGDRMFTQFDRNKSGFVDFDDFIIGLSVVCRGSADEKINFLFNMYDVTQEKIISRSELTTLLNHIPKEVLDHHPPSYPSHNSLISTSASDSGSGLGEYHPTIDTDLVEVDAYTNHDIVERAFAECDLHHDGRLSYAEFKMWIERNPSVLEYIESIAPYHGRKACTPHHHRKETLPHIQRITSQVNMGKAHEEVAGEVFNVNPSIRHSRRSNCADGSQASTSLPSSSNHSPITRPSMPVRTGSFGVHTNLPNMEMDSEEKAYLYLSHAFEITQHSQFKNEIASLLEACTSPEKTSVNGAITSGSATSGQTSFKKTSDTEVYNRCVGKEGFLYKRGKLISNVLPKRYFVLTGSCMYYYTHKDDVLPKGMVFLAGSLVERKDDDLVNKGMYGLEIVHQDPCTGEHYRHEKRVLYCKGKSEREEWLTALQHAAHVVPVEEDYVIGKELGRGRFSVVCDCVHKKTGEHAAVKVIDKKTIALDEKELLRTEIAVLKLVDHPNIIRLYGIYETKDNIYIVMEKLEGGELFERIVGRPRFSEVEAARLLRPLLESVAYLHDLGIVHRDLKPENILCGDELEDIKIADFGLSKMILPREKMDSACGTLSYVAPEVLTMQGYGKEADIWSIGVILFLLLCGKLPFDGADHNEIIRSTIQGDIHVNPSTWGRLSDDCKSLTLALLNKNPKERISARDALKHPFFINTLGRRHPGMNPSNSNNDLQSYINSSSTTIPTLVSTIVPTLVSSSS